MKATKKEFKARRDPKLVTHCPKCGTSSRIPTDRLIRVPDSEYILLSSRCNGCQKSFDLAYWTRDPIHCKLVEHGGHVEGDQLLLQRYRSAVNEVVATKGDTFLCDTGMFEIKGGVEADLTFLDAKKNPGSRTRPPIVPMDALALARGIRLAAMQDAQQFFKCMLGRFDLSLGLTELGDADPSYGMQFSVFDRTNSAPLNDRQLSFAISLCFTPEELSRSYEITSGRVRDFIVPLPSFYAQPSAPYGIANPAVPSAKKAS